MLKKYLSLKSARRSLIIQLLILLLTSAFICIAGRLRSGDVFDMELIVASGRENPENEGLRVEWEKKEESPDPDAGPSADAENAVSIRSMRVEDVQKDHLSGKALHLSMKPEEPGDYSMTVYDQDDHILATDSIHIDPFRTAFSWSTGSFTGSEYVLAACIVLYAGMLVISLVHFIRLKSPLFCSYDAILSAGIFLFCLVVIIVNAPVYIRHLRTPAFYQTWQLLSDIAAGGKTFVLYTYPLIFVFCLLLIISNIELLRHERLKMQNALGLILGTFMISAGLAYYVFFASGASASFGPPHIVSTIENVLGIVITYLECILLSSMICAFRAARHVPHLNMDYILILGCGFRKDGTLPPLLRGRVDKALEFWKRQKKETGKEAMVIPSGGQGRGEGMSESEAMCRYIKGTGFPESALLKEDRSANTYQNMEYSKKIIESRESTPDAVNTAYVTTNYHVFRSGIWAQLAGLRAEGLGSRTKWWYWPNAFVRECVGLLKNRIVSELILLVLLTAAVAVISYFAH